MGEYFSMHGLAFQAPSGDIEERMNIKIALKIIYDYIDIGGHQSEVEDAMRFIEKEFPKAKTYTSELRNYLFTEDLFGYEYREEICKYWFTKLVTRTR